MILIFLLLPLRNLIIEEKSFVPCENLKYGRVSFRGFNPEVEVCFCLSYVSSLWFYLCLLFAQHLETGQTKMTASGFQEPDSGPEESGSHCSDENMKVQRIGV